MPGNLAGVVRPSKLHPATVVPVPSDLAKALHRHALVQHGKGLETAAVLGVVRLVFDDIVVKLLGDHLETLAIPEPDIPVSTAPNIPLVLDELRYGNLLGHGALLFTT